MAVLAVVKEGAGTLFRKAADGAGNLVAKASSLSSVQVQAMNDAREKYLREKPETDPEFIKRRLGSYAIEAYEAYLTELQTLYRPISLGEIVDDTDSLEVTKWVTDPTENNLDKLTNLYRVLSEEACNIALIYDRKRSGVSQYRRYSFEAFILYGTMYDRAVFMSGICFGFLFYDSSAVTVK